MTIRDPRLLEIWSQKTIPIIYRRGDGLKVLLKLPYRNDNYTWIRGDKRHKPTWDNQFKCWVVPTTWFDNLINKCLDKYGGIYLIQKYREHQKCAPACWNAEGYHCECSCMGEHHGAGHPGRDWREISETFAFSWENGKYACRLIRAKINP